jgi:hypothetical protein
MMLKRRSINSTIKTALLVRKVRKKKKSRSEDTLLLTLNFIEEKSVRKAPEKEPFLL